MWCLKLLNGPEQGLTIKIDKGLLPLGKEAKASLRLATDEWLGENDVLGLYCLQKRLFVKVSREGLAFIINSTQKIPLPVSWKEVFSKTLILFGQHLIQIQPIKCHKSKSYSH